MTDHSTTDSNSTPAPNNHPSFACPECGCHRGRCLKTRHIKFRGIHFIMRVRRCDYCGFHFKSKEITVPDEEAPRQQKDYRKDLAERKALSSSQENEDEKPPPTEPPTKKPFVIKLKGETIKRSSKQKNEATTKPPSHITKDLPAYSPEPKYSVDDLEQELEQQRAAPVYEPVIDPDNPPPERPPHNRATKKGRSPKHKLSSPRRIVKPGTPEESSSIFPPVDPV